MRVLSNESGEVGTVKQPESAGSVNFSETIRPGPGEGEGQACNVLGTPTKEGKPKRDYKRSQHHASPRFSRRRLAGVRQVLLNFNNVFILSRYCTHWHSRQGTQFIISFSR